MSKAIEGVALLGGAAVLGAFTLGVGGVALEALANTVLAAHILTALVVGGLAMEAGAIASSLTANRGTNITTRQAAAFRQIIYGEQRVGGIIVYQSTTGGHHDQYNFVIVLAGHPCESIVNLYLDGRQVIWNPTNTDGNTTRPDGTNFGGAASGGNHIGPGGQTYNFDTLVYCEARYGDQVSGDVIGALTANDPNWTATSEGSPWLGGCTYVYLKIEYDTAMFPTLPEIRATVRGKNNIMDPRTGVAGYTSNWALIVADVLQDTQFGLGDVGSVNTAQLIAAANVCDESVALAAGGTEARYACHWHYDTGTDPGNVLATMMPAAAGRLSQIGGQWYIWPAYWQGPSFTFDENALTASPSWNPNRSLRDLFNRINGTYVAPNYPYNNAGNLYDSNGWYDGTLDNTFPFAFQPTNYPQYACDVLHGYASDQYLTDDGKPLPHELTQSCVLSVAQAQRVAKIMLLRNRQQGSGTFPMNLPAFEMQPTDVMQFTFAAMGWTEKTLEIVSTKMSVEYDAEVPAIRVSVGVQETAETVYEWSTTEELTVYDVPANPSRGPYTPVAPTGMSLTSGAATALVGADGIVRPRIEVQWDVPLDVLVKQVQTQFQVVSPLGPWVDAGLVDVGNTLTYIDNVVAGQEYNVRIRSLRANGAASPWEEIDGYTVSLTLSVATQFALAPGSLVGEAFSDGTAGIIVEPFTAIYGALSVAILPAGAYSLLGLEQQQLYFVYYVDPTFAGGAITPIATLNQSDFLNKVGYFLIDSIVTPYAGSGGGGGGGSSRARYAPSNFVDIGTQTTSSPASAYDGNLASFAGVGSTYRAAVGAGEATSTSADCIWEDFPAVTSTAGMELYVVASYGATGSGGTGSIEIAGTSAASFTSATGKLTYSYAIPTGTSLSTLTVEVAANAATGGSGLSTARVSVYEIYIQ